jgi:tripartite ATP-independent transporter DctP family solute receptor
MGSDQVVGKKLQMGAVEAWVGAVNNLAPYYPEFDIFTLPFLMKNFVSAEKALASDVVKELEEGAAKKANLKILGWTPSNFRNMTNSKHPILKPEDLRDLKFRVAKNPVMIDTYKALGGNPIGMAPTELFSALQTGVVDGQDGGAAWAYALKVYEVQKYLSVTNHQCVVGVLVFNNKFFTNLPEDVQSGLEKAAKEATIYITGWSRGITGDIVERYREKGMQIAYPDLKPFVEKVRPVWEKNAERVGGIERIQKIYNLQQ